MTCFYMFRLLFLVFYGSFRGTSEQQHHLHESPAVMTVPLLVLAVLSVFGGLINIPELLGGNTAQGNYLSFSIKNAVLHEGHLSHATELILLAISVLLLILIVMVAYHRFIRKNLVPPGDEVPKSFIPDLLANKYYIDELYLNLFVKPYNWLSDKILPRVETGIIDRIVNGFGENTVWLGEKVRRLQAGNISLYVFAMVSGIIFFIIINLYF